MGEESRSVASEDFLLEKPSPGSDACILIGRLPPTAVLPGGPLRAVLWLVDEASPGAQIHAASASAVRLGPATAAQIEAALVDFFKKSPKHLPALCVTRSLPPEYEAQYAEAIGIAGSVLEAQHRARVTRQADAFAWQSHILRNLAEYAASRVPDSWEGALTGIPAFIVGAGPSLDASIGALARHTGRAVVFAADSSLRALHRAGVEPDFVVSVDVAKTAAKCLLPDGPVPRRVVLSANSPPDWTPAVPAANRYFVSSNQLTLDWLASLGIARTTVNVCENSGATAIDLARFLGCAPICLFGMDLALDAAGAAQRHHGAVETSVYANSGFNAAQDFPKVPGNFSAEVPTHVIGDWRSLDRRFATWPSGLVQVVTDRGARLSNTTVVRPEDFALSTRELAREQTLAALSPPVPAPAALVRVVAEQLGFFGRRLLEWMPAVRQTHETAGDAGVAASLRSLFADPAHGRMLGAYSLKLMPHLLPPIEENAALWSGIIAEMEALGNAAIAAAEELDTRPTPETATEPL